MVPSGSSLSSHTVSLDEKHRGLVEICRTNQYRIIQETLSMAEVALASKARTYRWEGGTPTACFVTANALTTGGKCITGVSSICSGEQDLA